jgi:predicted TIM-barrel fold metal-dependent hydrolase
MSRGSRPGSPPEIGSPISKPSPKPSGPRDVFESNFPVDRIGSTYVTLRNAFKRLAKDHSADEKMTLFSGTATQVYRIAI